ICVSRPYAIYKLGAPWYAYPPTGEINGLDLDPTSSYYLNGVYFTDANYGLMVGGYIPGNTPPGGSHHPLVLSVIGGRINNERAPDVAGDLTGVAAFERGHALAVGTDGLILSNGYGFEHAPGPIPTAVLPFYTPTATPTPLPSEPVADPHRTDITY